jgi:hypothetical protein
MGGRVFEGERNYNAPAISVFGDKKWDVMLQTVNGFISKIAINVVLSAEREANQVALRLLGYCIKELGKPNEQRTGFFIWDTTDGNVILQTGETADGLAVALFLTSKSIQNFKKPFERPAENEVKPATEVTEPTYALYYQKPNPAADDAKKTEFSNNNSPGARFEKILHETKRKVEEQRRPINDLTLAIISAGWKCSQSVKPYFRPVKETAQYPHLQEMYVFYEFLYFFLHLMNRQAHRVKLSPSVLVKVQNELTAIIVPTAIDTFCAHWPEKLKSGIGQEFFENLNDAEREYATCKLGLFPKNAPIEDSALCSRLAMNIAKHAGYNADVERRSDAGLKFIDLVYGLVTESLTGPLKNFGEMVEKAGAAIEAADC